MPADPDQVFAAIDDLRIPAEYLASLFTAGKVAPIQRVLRKLTAVRAIMRAHQLGQPADASLATAAGASPADLEDLLYRRRAPGAARRAGNRRPPVAQDRPPG